MLRAVRVARRFLGTVAKGTMSISARSQCGGLIAIQTHRYNPPVIRDRSPLEDIQAFFFPRALDWDGGIG